MQAQDFAPEDQRDWASSAFGAVVAGVGVVSFFVELQIQLPWYASVGLILGGGYFILPRKMRVLGEIAAQFIRDIRGS